MYSYSFKICFEMEMGLEGTAILWNVSVIVGKGRNMMYSPKTTFKVKQARQENE